MPSKARIVWRLARVLMLTAALLVVSLALPASAAAAEGVQPQPPHDDGDRAAFLSDYVGRYELTSSFILNVTRVGDALYVESPGQAPSQMRARTRNEFVLVGSSLRIVFGFNPRTRAVDHLIFEQGGVGRRAEKLAEGTAAATTRTVVDLPTQTLARYVGVYEEQPGFAITIRLESGQLSAGMDGLPAQTILPESETEFFYEDARGSLTFEVGSDGAVDRLILHQGGSDVTMNRLPD